MISNSRPFHKTHSELLRDKKYLLWRFSPSRELDRYWNVLIKQNLELQKEIDIADGYLKKKSFPKRYLKVEKKEKILQEILFSVQQKRKNKEKKRERILRLVSYGTVASILLLIGMFIYQISQSGSTGQISIYQNETESIQLITTGKTTLFDKNISLQIDKMGIARIPDDNKGGEVEIAMSKNGLNKLIVPYGKRTTVTLYDGTKIWLNSGSTLTFPSEFEENKREISITGEMYIEVAENKKAPFFVKTSDFCVSVLGTKFCISAYEKQPQTVVLAEGKVNLMAKKTKKDIDFLLMPNEMALLNNNHSFSKRQVDASQYITWTKGYIILNETPVEDLLNYIARNYNFSLKCTNATNLKGLTCNGKLYLSDNIDNVMKSIAILSNTTYKKENNTIYIRNNKKIAK
ncbi:FecR family protein [Petrimonas sulfuriphila]|jgi:transmembrane sensor